MSRKFFYTSAERNRLHKRIKELAVTGLSYIQVADKMNAEGFKAPDGGPLTNTKISQQAVRGGFRKNRTRKSLRASRRPGVQATASVKASAMCQLFREILTNPALNESQRFSMIKGLVST